jgi:hypothetical protein
LLQSAFYVPASGKGAKMLGQNHFVEPNRLVLTFLHSIFNLQGHKLSSLKHFGEPNRLVLIFLHPI